MQKDKFTPYSSAFALWPAIVLLFLAGPVAPAKAAKPSSPASHAALQVEIIAPPTWRSMLDERVTESFVPHIRDVFHGRGLEGGIVEVQDVNTAAAHSALLTVNLIDWRMNAVGNIDCTFTADLQTERTIPSRGFFSGVAFRWMSGPGRFGFSEALDSAAEDAIRQLHDAVEKTGMVPEAKSGRNGNQEKGN